MRLEKRQSLGTERLLHHGAWLAAGLGFLVLNTLLVFHNSWPGMGVALVPRLSLEMFLGLVALAWWVGRRGVLSPRGRTWLAIGLVGLVLVRYANVTAPSMMGRPVHVYWDGRHLLEVGKVLGSSWPAWQIATWGLLLVVGLVVLYGVVRVSLEALEIGLRRPDVRYSAQLLAITGVVAFAIHPLGPWDTRRHFSAPILPTVVQQGVLLTQALQPHRYAATLGPSPAFDTDLSALQTDSGPLDVLLLFAESYGAITLDDEDFAAALGPARQRLTEALERAGWSVVSGRVRASTFGGASWLSHGSLLSGVDTSDPLRYSLLLTSQRPTLVSHFAAHGYRTVGWMPGIKRLWPEGLFFSFDRIADDAIIGYQGLDFGYWRIPDQASMALLHDQEFRTSPTQRQPVFAVFPTITSHAPFHPLPPLLSSALAPLDAHAYTPADVMQALANPPTAGQATGPYLRSISDLFDWLAVYIDDLAPPNLMLLMVGDHQPPGIIRGDDASWDVPVHIMSAHDSVLQRLEAKGFVAGLLPSHHTLATMHGLTQILLDVFDADSGMAE